MRKEETVRLDTHFLVRRVESLGLKQGWVADSIGVSRKTVNRWCTGKIKRLATDNARALCGLLDCDRCASGLGQGGAQRREERECAGEDGGYYETAQNRSSFTRNPVRPTGLIRPARLSGSLRSPDRIPRSRPG